MPQQFHRSLVCVIVALTLVARCVAQSPTNNTLSAEFVEYQFNETRGMRVANVASTDTCASHGVVSLAGWHGAAQNTGFDGNEPGFGALSAGGSAALSPWIDIGWSGTFQGSLTFGFWLQPTAAAAVAGNPFGYVWGGGIAANSARLFQAGGAGRGIRYAGTTLGNFTLPTDIFTGRGGVWQHIALVIDDVAGVASWYHDGVFVTSTSFTPGTHTFTKTSLYVGRDLGTGSNATQWCSFDDFRMYTRALSAAEVLAIAATENPTTGTFGMGCPGPGGVVPTIGASGGPPQLGSTTFTLEFAGLEPSVPMAVHFGVFADNGGATPLDVGFLLGAGCALETLPQVSVALAQSGTASLPLPIDAATMFGLHFYAQGVLLGSTGAVTELLDINMQ